MFLLRSEEEHPDGHSIGRQAHTEDDDVQHWKEDLGELALQYSNSSVCHRHATPSFITSKASVRVTIYTEKKQNERTIDQSMIDMGGNANFPFTDSSLIAEWCGYENPDYL